MTSSRTTVALVLALAAGIAGSVLLRRLEPAQEPSSTASDGVLPQRIIPMAPNLVETVFALGAGDRVVGVSSYTIFPPEAAAKPQVGALFDPNLERIVALDPDLIIIQQKHEKVEALCRERGIALLTVEMVNLRGILEGIREIGARIGDEDDAADLAADILSGIDGVSKSVEGRPRRKVFLCLGRTPGSLKGLFTVGGTSFLSELIGVAGGENIFDDIPRDFPEISVESLNARAPDVIIETYPSQEMSAEMRAQFRKDWNALPDLPAVKEGRIYFLTQDYILLPGPRIVEIARRFAETLHPEALHAR
jgi:iron complex transport system substrate-binding protein